MTTLEMLKSYANQAKDKGDWTSWSFWMRMLKEHKKALAHLH